MSTGWIHDTKSHFTRKNVVTRTEKPDPQKPSLPLQPKTTATLGPFTATKSFVTATFTATFGAEIDLKAENIFLILY